MKQAKPLRLQEDNKYLIIDAFDKYISLFAVPLGVFIYAVFFVKTKDIGGWEGLIAGIWMLFAVIAAIVDGLFFLVNRYWLRWDLKWWKNLLISAILFLASSFLFGLIIRLST
ncbi:MAG: hypothetical protein KC535_03405 [Nanoarchaeota archaeon]|nr:hypothetical protein [Nanoarchaeota archaeon]